MTSQKALKRRVRERMSKTGESYTSARRHLLTRARRPEKVERVVQAPSPIPPELTTQSEAAVRKRTGRGWAEWFALLDSWGAARREHPEIARWLVANHEVSGWWAQGITVSYERVRGLRAPHQVKSGFSISAN